MRETARSLPAGLWHPSLRGVLHLAIAERPVLAAGINKADPDVLLAYALPRVNFVGNVLIELLLYLGRATADPGDLDDDQVWRVVDAQIALLRIDDLVWLVPGDDLEFVVVRHVRDPDHRVVDSVADIPDAFARSGFADVDSDERHDGVLTGIGFGRRKLMLDIRMLQTHNIDS